jgi:hypothetical protein
MSPARNENGLSAAPGCQPRHPDVLRKHSDHASDGDELRRPSLRHERNLGFPRSILRRFPRPTARQTITRRSDGVKDPRTTAALPRLAETPTKGVGDKA